MSLGARATKGGAKSAGAKDAGVRHGGHPDKGKGAEKPQPKDKVKPQATTEQLRMAHMIDRKNEDTSDVRRMVADLMEMTCRTEEEVCSALHDSDNDMVLACNLLLEESQRIQGEWQTNEKKKKKSGGAAAGNGDAEPSAQSDPRSRSGPRQRREGGGGEGAPRGRGSGRGRGAARGGRAGGRGTGRPRAPRPNTHHDPWPDSAVDNGPAGGVFPTAEDWDNEEWSGSLADTKVFTPSTAAQESEASQAALNNIIIEDWDTPAPESHNGPTADSAQLNYTYHNTGHQSVNSQVSSSAVDGRGALESLASAGSAPSPLDLSHSHAVSQPQQPIGLSGTLSAAQSQYLSRLTQQTQQQNNSVYTSNYGVYGASELTSQRKPQRARVPPPSKIPSSAVEMPGEPGQMGFIDVQFGALEPDTLADTQPGVAVGKQAAPQPEQAPAPAHLDPAEQAGAYSNAAGLLSDSLSAVDTTQSSQSVSVDTQSQHTNNTTLESQLSASMKQLSASESVSANAASSVGSPEAATTQATRQYAAYHQQQQQQQQQQYVPPHRTAKHQQQPSVGQQQSVYAAHHAVSHHPVYGANVYAQQVNSTNASLTAASMTSVYPPSVTLPQYHTQPLNSYQTSSSASVYGGSALYTAAPYNAYQPTPAKLSSKDSSQYDSSVASSNSLTSTSTTQSSAAKVTTTAGKVSSGSNASSAQYAVQAQPSVQPQAFYTQQQGQAGAAAAYAAYEEAQMMRGTLPHHMGGYYEVGYGVGGVTGAREPAGGFGLGGGERFGRADASSPQQVAAALPPGYHYFFQPPPTTYQYGVYPYGGGGSSVGGVTGVGGVAGAAAGKVAGYSQQQQPQYEATQPQQDTYKQGAYSGAGSKTAATAGAELTNAMYAKAHATLNKVNSYEKAAFHSGTPPPFGGGSAGGHHLYITAAPPAHHNPHHHHQQPQHQETSGGAARGGAGAGKPAGNKPAYSQSYWAPN